MWTVTLPVDVVSDLGEAVRRAASIARPGDTVLLSPGCASFDLYPNFEARGDHFRALVTELGQPQATHRRPSTHSAHDTSHEAAPLTAPSTVVTDAEPHSSDCTANRFDAPLPRSSAALLGEREAVLPAWPPVGRQTEARPAHSRAGAGAPRHRSLPTPCHRSRSARSADRHVLRDRRGRRRLRHARPRHGLVGLCGHRSEHRELAVSGVRPPGDVGGPRTRRSRDRGEGAVLPWRRMIVPIGLLGVAVMCLPFVPGLGASINGASSWIRLGGLSMQPSEFLKLAVVVLAADLLGAAARRRRRCTSGDRADHARRRYRRGTVPRPG